MAWYDDERKESHTQRYENAELAGQDADRAQAKGWQVQRRTTAQNQGSTLRYGILPGEIETASYQRGEVELTFIRTEEWMEQHRKV